MRPLLLALVFVATVASGQDKPAPATAAPTAAPAQAPVYAYNAEGRRDPFVSLLRRASDTRRSGGTGGKPAAGVAGFLVSEIELKGIMLSRGTQIALVLGPDNKTYMVRANDRLLDGSVRAITSDTIVLMQDVNDPLSLTKQREVRKTLRAVVEAK
jgi:Tfp pilus assembly protein PilP